MTVDGKPIKAVAQPTKQGWVDVFDRVTVKPVWPIRNVQLRKARCLANGIRRHSRS